MDLEKSRAKRDDPGHEKDLEVCIRANNNAWIIARSTRGKELYMVLEKANETLLYASDAVEQFSNRYRTALICYSYRSFSAVIFDSVWNLFWLKAAYCFKVPACCSMLHNNIVVNFKLNFYIIPKFKREYSSICSTIFWPHLYDNI